MIHCYRSDEFINQCLKIILVLFQSFMYLQE
uniref:Uncharacterized protein n=1 Tax=Lepeophtheirus salmonis TaxID=72036 RepID=A0A0K2TQW7_LEPSM